MTTTRNFPHKKHARRLGALARLEVNLLDDEKILVDPLYTNHVYKKTVIEQGIRRMKKEISVLEERTRSGGGRKSTKKVHANTGRK